MDYFDLAAPLLCARIVDVLVSEKKKEIEKSDIARTPNFEPLLILGQHQQ